MDERDLLNAWRNLFLKKPITVDLLTTAELMLDGLAGESPLHLRLAGELAELKKRSALGGSPTANSRRKR